MLRLVNRFRYWVVNPGDVSRDPMGRPDPRWRNRVPSTMRASLEIEFEEGDREKVLELLRLLGQPV